MFSWRQVHLSWIQSVQECVIYGQSLVTLRSVIPPKMHSTVVFVGIGFVPHILSGEHIKLPKNPANPYLADALNTINCYPRVTLPLGPIQCHPTALSPLLQG